MGVQTRASADVVSELWPMLKRVVQVGAPTAESGLRQACGDPKGRTQFLPYNQGFLVVSAASRPSRSPLRRQAAGVCSRAIAPRTASATRPFIVIRRPPNRP